MSLFGLARPLLFALPPECAHALTIETLACGLVPSGGAADPEALAVSAFGLDFPNPIGLAAGFDKNARVPDAVFKLGFGFAEAGTMTPRPQAGNPKPRLFRLTADEAVINRLGFNNDGHGPARARLASRKDKPGILGINLGANRDSLDPIVDYCAGLKTLGPFAHYATINISSPNTPGLRSLQKRAPLERLCAALTDTRRTEGLRLPLLLKIAPDIDDSEAADIVEVALAYGLDGLIVSNTTVARPASLKSRHRAEAGGLSGKPLFALSTERLAFIARRVRGRLPLVGVGGIASGADVYAKIRAGATLVQLYTALIYQGPGLIKRLKRELAGLIARDGYDTVRAAVGADLR